MSSDTSQSGWKNQTTPAAIAVDAAVQSNTVADSDRDPRNMVRSVAEIPAEDANESGSSSHYPKSNSDLRENVSVEASAIVGRKLNSAANKRRKAEPATQQEQQQEEEHDLESGVLLSMPCKPRVKKRRPACRHRKRRKGCKDCEGTAICDHGKRRWRCKYCGGSVICQHGKERRFCKDCSGSDVCEHNKHRRNCKDCRGTGICEHGKRRRICKDCGGSGICEHGKRRYICKDCGGSGICEHGKQRHICKECRGFGICEHDKLKQRCKDCGGSGICEHGKERRYCKHCVGLQIVKRARGVGGGSRETKSVIAMHNPQSMDIPTKDDGAPKRKRRKLATEKPAAAQATPSVDVQQLGTGRPLAEYSVKELKALLTERGLMVSGVKGALVQRLEGFLEGLRHQNK